MSWNLTMKVEYLDETDMSWNARYLSKSADFYGSRFLPDRNLHVCLPVCNVHSLLVPSNPSWVFLSSFVHVTSILFEIIFRLLNVSCDHAILILFLFNFLYKTLVNVHTELCFICPFATLRKNVLLRQFLYCITSTVLMLFLVLLSSVHTSAPYYIE